jgi:arylsulfatase A-like enzyme
LTGHFNGGWGSENWSNSVRMVDGQLGRIFQAVESNPAMSNRTAIILTTDHGGQGLGHSVPDIPANFTIPFFLWGPGIPSGADLYSLFANRGNPGTNRVDYTVAPQPIRNGDAGNLVLALFGLPPIPGSLMIPEFAVPGMKLEIHRSGPAWSLVWPASAEGFILETTNSLQPPVQWEPVTRGIQETPLENTFSIDSFHGSTRFYRLRRN